jgi:acetyl-CoA/propionyl-CoA carboxylase biotin carboxyl carrier protein
MGEALERARREAEAYFKNPEVYLERYFLEPHHVEIQVLGDRHGNLVHLGERDCSVQRRHQKLIEEAPSPVIDRDLRRQMGEMAVRAAQSAGYFSAGTVEFLVTPEREFYFLEMNTRIQVEHPVTEMVTGTDLIREMVLVAAGEPLDIGSDVLEPNGHSIEVRINAEDPLHDFQPTPRQITEYREAGGIGVRVDSGVYAGYHIPQHYDSLLAKLIIWAPDREGARRRALRALGEYRIGGPETTIPFAAAVLRQPAFIEGKVSTGFVASHMDELQAAIGREAEPPSGVSPATVESVRSPERTFDVEVNRKLFRVRVAEVRPKREPVQSRRQSHRPRTAQGNELVSPMHGTVLTIKKQPGDTVSEGETMFIIEAMKMENEVAAHRSGAVKAVLVKAGDTVETDQQLAVIE